MTLVVKRAGVSEILISQYHSFESAKLLNDLGPYISTKRTSCWQFIGLIELQLLSPTKIRDGSTSSQQ